VERAVLAEEALRGHVGLVEDIHKRNGILAERGRKDDHFVVLAHLVYEFATVGANLHENVADAALNVDRQNDVSLVRGRERTMHEGLVHVENERLLALELFGLGREQIVARII
jgi:hypothetical protein